MLMMLLAWLRARRSDFSTLKASASRRMAAWKEWAFPGPDEAAQAIAAMEARIQAGLARRAAWHALVVRLDREAAALEAELAAAPTQSQRASLQSRIAWLAAQVELVLAKAERDGEAASPAAPTLRLVGQDGRIAEPRAGVKEADGAAESRPLEVLQLRRSRRSRHTKSGDGIAGAMPIGDTSTNGRSGRAAGKEGRA